MIRITLKSRPIVLDEAAKFDLPDVKVRLSSKEHYDFIAIDLIPLSMKLSDAGAILIMPCDENQKIWRVWSIKAPRGFGPPLYEFAMELAQLKGGIGLTPDPSVVSQDAQKVWQHYLTREDVETLPLPTAIRFATPRPDEIKKVFRKKNPDYIQKLVAAGKVDDPQGILK